MALIKHEVEYDGMEIAIIGMAGHFPGADDIDEFWLNLKNGIESVSFFSIDEVDTSGLNPEILKDPHYVRAGGMLKNVDEFDAGFFGFYPKEASILDPQHRVFIEVAWEALENSGYDPEEYNGWIGLYAGTGMNTYLIYNLITNQEIIETVHGYQLTISNDKDFLPTRVSYKLNLHGPSINIQTACSTSLVATHLACQSLLNFQCDMALAGGVNIRLPQKQGYLYQEGGISSPDGHCRAFDEKAQGTVGGNGAGVVVLKRLSDAIIDCDHIYAIIKGSAINNDGSQKVGYTAPSIDGQAEVIAMAQAVANVDPDSITYIEAHGTGTSLGDPIELAALTQVFRKKTDRRGFCAIGSVKTNIGHLDAAAGISSLIKTALSLQNKEIPPSINFEKPNPKIDFDSSPFYVNTRLKKWDGENFPLRAGVSSFGIGGTNAHVVLEESPELPRTSGSRKWQMLLLSARTETALEKMSSNLLTYLRNNPSENMADIAFTLQLGRRNFPYRKVILARDVKEAIIALEGSLPENILVSVLENQKSQVIFMCTGQGSQYIQMAQNLYENEPVFKNTMNHCSEIIYSFFGIDLKAIIYPSSKQLTEEELQRASDLLRQTKITQPALFSIEYAMAQLLISWGIMPVAAIGHSIGEYVAATLAGVFSLEDALEIVSIRGQLMQSMPAGSMISISLSEVETRKYLFGNLSLASVNSTSLCVISGPEHEIDELITRLSNESVEFRRLITSHAFHSSMMDPILDEYQSRLAKIDLHPPEFIFISNLSGTWITPEQAMSPEYWTNHLRNTVRFSEGISELMKDPSNIFIEIGPGRTLSVFAKSNPSGHLGRIILPTIRHPQDMHEDDFLFYSSISRLWLAGIKISWKDFYNHEERRRIPLPTYPFEREQYWVEPDSSFIGFSKPKENLYKKNRIVDWFYLPSWERTPLLLKTKVDISENKTRNWLIFVDDEPIDDYPNFTKNLISYLIDKKQQVVLVIKGKKFQKLEPSLYKIDPKEQNDYLNLLNNLKEINLLPNCIIHLWSASHENKHIQEVDQFEEFQSNGFYSLLFLAQALGKIRMYEPLQVGIVTKSIHEVTGYEDLNPFNSTIMGLCRVIPQEYPNIECFNVDLEQDPIDETIQNQWIETFYSEFLTSNFEPVIAYRGRYRWLQSYQPVRQPINMDNFIGFRQNGVYLLTGGLGRIAITFAKYLAEKFNAHLALIDRVRLPEKKDWDNWLSSHELGNPVSIKLNALNEIERLGSNVIVISAEVSDTEQLSDAVKTVLEHFGTINGIFHTAGFVGENSIRSIQETQLLDCKMHFDAKVYGLFALVEAMKQTDINLDELDFVLLQSSLSSILGGLGLGSYSSANIFMDSYSSYVNKVFRDKFISVNWDGWTFGESEISKSSSPGRSSAGTTLVELSMTPDEGLLVLEKILNGFRTKQLIISTADLETRINQWVKHEKIIESRSDGIVIKGSHHNRPKLPTAYVQPRTSVEFTLVEMWQKILGIDPIGIYDDFFELGGHSLLATQLITRVRDHFKIEFPLRKLFETPTVAGLAILIQESNNLEKNITPIIPVSREIALPLSFGQQRLWFLDQLEPNSPLYNNFAAVMLEGEVNIDALKHSFNEIVRRHEVLRTTFQEKNGQPEQVITSQGVVPINRIDLSNLTSPEIDEEVKRLALIDAKTPFNLSEGPLFRVSLIRINLEEYLVFLTTHHIVSDGWSVNIIINEVGSLYRAFYEGKASLLPSLPIQFADYAVWQRQWLSGDYLEEQLSYWKNQLSAMPTSLDLMTDYPRPLRQTPNGASIWFELPENLTNEIKTYSQKEGLTLFMTLMGAIQVLLFKYSGQKDFAIGTPIDNRNRVEIESLIGFILNTLVFRANLTGNPTFNDLLQRVKETALGAYAHQDLAFEMLVDAIQPQRDMSKSPIFQVMFDLQDATQRELNLPGIIISPHHVDTGTAKFDLAISVEEHENNLKGYFNYNVDLFDQRSIEQMIKHFSRILTALIENPSVTLSDIQVLDDFELHQLLIDWNTTSKDLGEFIPLVDLFRYSFSNRGNAIAVSLDDQVLTYNELNIMVLHEAEKIREANCGQGDIIGLMANRSIEAIIGMIAIWFAGCVYLPIDPELPDDRLDFILEDAEVNFILTQDQFIDKFHSHNKVSNYQIKILLLETGNYRIDPIIVNKSSIVAFNSSPESLAYVIYTSGSTGKPKGVTISHRAISNHCRVIKEHFAVNKDDQVLQFSAYSFDQSIEQILVTLISGAKLVLRGPEIWNPEDFSEVINKNQLTIINIQPVYWYQWLLAETKKKNQISNDQLKLVIIGGDVIYKEHVDLWMQTTFKNVRLLNAYGPTETTITSSTYEIKPFGEKGKVNPRIPIGRPLPNRYFYILDENRKPTPIGVPGELYIGGENLSKGYLNRSELTEERFVPNPFINPDPKNFEEQLMYRTGDLVRYLPSGDIEFIGRVDFQVKIRGFRIELGEIESVLRNHPSIDDVVVLASNETGYSNGSHQDLENSNDKKLIAFLVLNNMTDPQEFRISEIRNYAKGKLPAYMIPSVYKIVDFIPLLPSGKVDRKQLYSKDNNQLSVAELESTYVSPRTTVEEDLVKIWQSILGLERVGINDNFFELGGHSLLATQIASRIREIYRVELPLRILFESPTIASLATAITQSLVDKELASMGEGELEQLFEELDELSEEQIRSLLDGE